MDDLYFSKSENNDEPVSTETPITMIDNTNYIVHFPFTAAKHGIQLNPFPPDEAGFFQLFFTDHYLRIYQSKQIRMPPGNLLIAHCSVSLFGAVGRM